MKKNVGWESKCWLEINFFQFSSVLKYTTHRTNEIDCLLALIQLILILVLYKKLSFSKKFELRDPPVLWIFPPNSSPELWEICTLTSSVGSSFSQLFYEQINLFFFSFGGKWPGFGLERYIFCMIRVHLLGTDIFFKYHRLSTNMLYLRK